MNPQKLAKAIRLRVYPANTPNLWHVPGKTAIYAIRLSPWSGKYTCECAAFFRFGQECSHIIALKHHLETSTHHTSFQKAS